MDCNDESRLARAIPQVQAAALEHHHDPGLFERAGAQFEQKLGCFLPVSARDLKAARPNILGEDGKGDAQRRLPELVHEIRFSVYAMEPHHRD